MPPNVLWIVLEDTSPRVGPYGDRLARTPHLEDLATDGRRYDLAFSTTGVCAPSRASLMTGMMPQSLGAQHMRTATHPVHGLPEPYACVPPHYVTALPELLRSAGYYCTLDVKTDYQFGEPATMWDRHAPGAGWWDDARDSDQPFFAMMTNAVTHESGMWNPADRTPRPEGGVIAQPDTDPADVAVPPFLVDGPETRTAIARQYDNIAAMDAWVGTLLDRLAVDGHAEDTVVVLVGDHGEGLPRKKRWPYDGGTHVPLIVRWPGVTNGGSTDRLVSGTDLAPTTLSIAGIAPPGYMDGRAVCGPYEQAPRTYVRSTRDRVDESYDMVRSLRDDRYRYIRHYAPMQPFLQYVPYRDHHPAMQELRRAAGTGSLSPTAAAWFAESRPAEELYDLATDPHEVENLADEPTHADTLDRFRTELDTWRIRTGRPGDDPERTMRNRGWPDGRQPTTAAPRFVVHGPDGRLEGPPDGEGMSGPITVGLYCPTQGASLEWGIDGDRWHLYRGPIHVGPGTTKAIKARAVRYGFRQSHVAYETIRVR